MLGIVSQLRTGRESWHLQWIADCRKFNSCRLADSVITDADANRTKNGTLIMAEQFILSNGTSKIVRNFLKATSGCTITPLAHANIGWNNNSVAQYNGMMGLNDQPAIVGRAGLPPHFYIEIQAQTTILDPATSENTDLIRYLSRGRVPDVLKALDRDSVDHWNQGHALKALQSELGKGNVSISLYYLDGKQVDQVTRDKVNSFPRKSG